MSARTRWALGVGNEFAEGQIVSGYYEPLIERNTTVPLSRAKIFSAFNNQQDEILIEVFQGEARMTKDNHLLGKLRVTGLRQTAGATRPGSVEVRFSYDMSGLLEVDATVLHSGKKFHTAIEERPGKLSAKQIEAIRQRLAPLKISARDRIHNRARIERAQRLYAALTGEARQEIAQVLDMFEHALETKDEAGWEEAGQILDAVLARHTLEEG